MECGFDGCPRPQTTRSCVVCDRPAHHLCSNEALAQLGVKELYGICFCSVSCHTDYTNSDQTSPAETQHRRSYTFKFKREVLEDLEHMSSYAAEELRGVPRRTIRNWEINRDAIMSFEGSEKSRAARPGRAELIPFSADLIMFMKDRRRMEKVRLR
ncbi:hypothetical protein PHMEG_00027021 [Phytophthora megakarya]|uniref:Uncharacterized protein n=1 Tax=Phytophthora megakarya TaxID=4795 RepID=A0A225V8D6_9STRA|nr:hypothetical protein PHMEG_00027021 [Phytophthora megakarya]